MAGQPFFSQGFRGGINGPWKVAAVTNRYEKQSGYITEITLEALNKGKQNNKNRGWAVHPFNGTNFTNMSIRCKRIYSHFLSLKAMRRWLI